MTTPLPEGDPHALGFDPDRLAAIGPAMQAYIDDRRVPNLVTLVARRGQIVHFEARGVLDFESGRPATTDSLFRMFSNTKPLAGVALSILYERGLASPDDPVGDYLPEWFANRVQVPNSPGMTERARRRITLRDCITNTTGIVQPASMPMSYRDAYRAALKTIGWIPRGEGVAAPPSRERVRALAELPLMAHPGEHFGYHVGYPVLTEALTVASGQTMDRFFEENIFAPLKMSNTGFYVSPERADDFGDSYVPREVDGTTRLTVFDAAKTSEKIHGANEFCIGGSSGGIVATAGDYARFGQMLLNGGELDGARILGRKTVDLMVGNHTGDMEIPMTGPGFHWGLGVSTYHGRNRPAPLIRSIGSYGWGGAAGTTYWADPAEELLGVCLTQVMQHGTMPKNDYQDTFQRMVYQALV